MPSANESPKLTEKQLDALKEIGTIGSGHAAISLSQLLGERINIAVTRVEVVPSENFASFVGGSDKLIAAVYLQMLGDMRGGVFMLFKRGDVLKLADLLMKRPKGTCRMLTEMDQSAVKESGNVICGSYLSTLGLMVSLNVTCSIPRFAFDELEGLMEGIFTEVMKSHSRMPAVITEFIESTCQIRGYFVFMPQAESLEKLLKGLKV